MLDALHFPRGASRFAASFFPSGFARGFFEATRMYGLLLSHVEVEWVSGYFYAGFRRVPTLEGAGPITSREELNALIAGSVALRDRLAVADAAISSRAWLADLALWDDEVKPLAIRENRALQREDPASASDTDLLRHLVAAHRNAEMGVFRHTRFTMTAGLPLGDLLVHASEWTGQPYEAILRSVRGYSPISAGVATRELHHLAEVMSAASEPFRLDEEQPSATLKALATAPGAVGVAARAWLDEVSYRMVTGYDVTDRFGLEVPGGLVTAIRSALSSPGSRADASTGDSEEAARLRDRVPDAHRPAFDVLLADARAVYRLRDERNHHNDGWATGLMRRALLEAGARLASSGRISEAAHVFDASQDEVLAMLRGDAAPGRAELDARVEHRRQAGPPPPLLGPPPSPPLPPDWLEPGPARLARAAQAFLFGAPPLPDAADSTVLRGIPVSRGVYEGTVRLVLTTAHFADLCQGEVLVTPATSPHFNVLLPLLGAIVTDRGGALSHAAIVAREYGIPAVVGTKYASLRLRTGQRVVVDGDAGEVRTLS
jgi:pyruvate,water dikinase